VSISTGASHAAHKAVHALDVPLSRLTIDHSITQPLHPFRQLLRTSLRIAARGLQILVTKNLSQTHQIVPIVNQELLRHRVPKNMRVQANPNQR
jgi:hypothetical protein